MFRGCSNLLSSPEIMATDMLSSAANSMFYATSKISKIYVPHLSTLFSMPYTNWVNNAGTNVQSGIEKEFYCPASLSTYIEERIHDPDLSDQVYNVNAIPVGWTIKYVEDE